MFVPYGDPAATQYRKLVLDEGEYGIGLLANSLELGCDCLGEIRYLDGVVNHNDGKPVVMPNAICLQHGTIVGPGLYGPHHQHFFNVRLDMAIDGTANRVYEVTPKALPEGPGNPLGNAWRTEEVLIEDETQARRQPDPLAGRVVWLRRPEVVASAGSWGEHGVPAKRQVVS